MANDKFVLITGATSGIGFELGKIFSRKGYNLILVARNEDCLKKAKNEFTSNFHNHIYVIPIDLSQYDAPQKIYNRLKKEAITVNILVNNAGFGIYGDFTTVDVEKHINLIQVNITALTALSRLFLSDMIKRKEGKLLNIASTAAFQPGPHMVTYYASKAYVLSFSEALASELKGTGVTVTTLCPGPTKTNFEKESNVNKSRLFKVIKPMSAEVVAQKGYDGLMKGKTIVIPGWRNAFLAFGNRFVPRSISTQLSKFALE